MITYTKGDATKPKSYGVKIIAHVVNRQGGWGKGFVLALSHRWEEPERAYRSWAKSKDGTFTLGHVQLVKVEPDMYVANMVAQDGYRSTSNQVPLRYYALEDCLKELRLQANLLKATVHMPRIGSGLGGAEWPKVEALIKQELPDVEVTIYDL
jgi:O-acetyl-ADP-ribose deacetylase (regulator of RNase III)